MCFMHYHSVGSCISHKTKIYARMNNTVIQKIESPLEQIMKTMKSKNMYIQSPVLQQL